MNSSAQKISYIFYHIDARTFKYALKYAVDCFATFDNYKLCILLLKVIYVYLFLYIHIPYFQSPAKHVAHTYIQEVGAHMHEKSYMSEWVQIRSPSTKSRILLRLVHFVFTKMQVCLHIKSKHSNLGLGHSSLTLILRF